MIFRTTSPGRADRAARDRQARLPALTNVVPVPEPAEAGALTSLGDVHLSAGGSGAARRAWAQALRILEEIDHADASSVRAKLTSHVGPGQAGALVGVTKEKSQDD